jgi:hypothetical protein
MPVICGFGTASIDLQAIWPSGCGRTWRYLPFSMFAQGRPDFQRKANSVKVLDLVRCSACGGFPNPFHNFLDWETRGWPFFGKTCDLCETPHKIDWHAPYHLNPRELSEVIRDFENILKEWEHEVTTEGGSVLDAWTGANFEHACDLLTYETWQTNEFQNDTVFSLCVRRLQKRNQDNRRLSVGLFGCACPSDIALDNHGLWEEICKRWVFLHSPDLFLSNDLDESNLEDIPFLPLAREFLRLLRQRLRDSARPEKTANDEPTAAAGEPSGQDPDGRPQDAARIPEASPTAGGPVDQQPQDAGKIPDTTPTAADDFRSVNWYGTTYEFTATQAACFRVLWEHYQQRTPAVGEQTILESADSSSSRLSNVFRTKKSYHPAWNSIIVPAGKGAFKLQRPPEKKI